MNLLQLRALQAARAAHRFLTQDPPPASLANAPQNFQQQVSALKDLIDAVGARGTEQIPDTRKDRNAARNTAALQLRDGTLRPLRQVAHVIAASKAKVALGTDFPNAISVPKTSNVEAIIQSARLAAEKLEPYQALFVARGVAPDFLAQLTAETNAVEALANDAHDARGAQVNATREIGRLLREIRHTLRCLGVAVRRLCAQDGPRGAVIYQTWQQIKRPLQPAVASEASDTTGASAPHTSAGTATTTPAIDTTKAAPSATVTPATPTQAAA